MSISIQQFAKEMRIKREAKKFKLNSYLNVMQAGVQYPQKRVDIKEMRETVSKVHAILPHLEGPVNDTFEKTPRVFFSSQEDFLKHTQDQPLYWNDVRVKKVFNALSKLDPSNKKASTLVALKKIFTDDDNNH